MSALFLVVLAVVFGSYGHPVTIVDENNSPITSAPVVFVDARGGRDVERTDAAGLVAARLGFTPVRLAIGGSGYEPSFVTLGDDVSRIVIHRMLTVVAAVRVATGSPESLHRLPVAAAALDRVAISSNPSATSDALLRMLPGFDRNRSNSAFTNYGQLRASFAGAGNDRGLVLVDGLPAQDGFGGQIDWAAYPPDTIERAELLLGAGSALYGSGAIGGVLDIRTFGPPPGNTDVPSGSITAVAGSHAFSSLTINVDTNIDSKLGVALSAHVQRMQYRDLPPDYRSAIDDPARSESGMASAKFRYHASQSSTLEFGALGAWDAQYEGRPNYVFSRRLTQTDLRFLHASAKGAINVSYLSRTAGIDNSADQFPSKPGVLRYIQNVATGESDALASWIVDNAASSFEARAEARWVHGLSDQHGPTGALQSSGSGKQNLDGLAVQELLRGPRAGIVVGARFDSVTFSNGDLRPRSDAAISPRLALHYDLSRTFTVRISSGAGFRAPYLNELVRGYFIGNVSFEPNPSLVPERSRTMSAGLDWLAGPRRAALDIFDTQVRDAIAFRTIDQKHEMYSNLDQTKTQGATLTYSQLLGACTRVSISSTAQNARVAADPGGALVGKQLAYVPRISATLGIDSQVGAAAVGLSASYLGKTYADDLNAQPLGTAIVMGARVRVPLSDGTQLSISAENITGAEYLSSVDRYGPPRVISVGLTFPLGRDAATMLHCR